MRAQKNYSECSTSPTYLSTSYLEILNKRISLTSLKLEKHHFTYKMQLDPLITQKSKGFKHSQKAQTPWIMKNKIPWHAFFLFPFELTNLVEGVQFTLCYWHR